MHYDELQRKINYEFRDLSLLDAAMTHSSYANEQNMKCGARRVMHNETLEFLGDAVLGFTIAEHLYGASPQENEGGLSRKRAAIVCERSLADCARALGIGCLIRLGKSTGKAKDRDKPSILSDAMEALFAAVYLDGGMEAAKRVILSALGSAVTASMTVSQITDYKTCLQEQLHNGKITDIEYAVVRETGPDHDKTFTSSVAANGKVLGTGSGSTKKESEQNAARVALAGLAGAQAERAAATQALTASRLAAPQAGLAGPGAGAGPAAERAQASGASGLAGASGAPAQALPASGAAGRVAPQAAAAQALTASGLAAPQAGLAGPGAGAGPAAEWAQPAGAQASGLAGASGAPAQALQASGASGRGAPQAAVAQEAVAQAAPPAQKRGAACDCT